MDRREIIIDEVAVDRHILVKPYECDVRKLNCSSLCCMRGCIITSREIERLHGHLEHILDYLSTPKRDLIHKNGTFLADCAKQCPQGCEILPEEKKAVTVFLEKKEKPKCIEYMGEDGCIFLYDRLGIKLCAIHSYALDKGIALSDIKPLDCIQYPIYCYHSKGRKKLAVQKNSLISSFPCMKMSCGSAMYKNLTHATSNLLGEDFNKKLARYAESGQMELFLSY